MAFSRRVIPVVMGVREAVMVLGVVIVVVFVGLWSAVVGLWSAVVGLGFGGVRFCQIVLASGRSRVGSVVMGSVPRRKNMERGGLV